MLNRTERKRRNAIIKAIKTWHFKCTSSREMLIDELHRLNRKKFHFTDYEGDPCNIWQALDDWLVGHGILHVNHWWGFTVRGWHVYYCQGWQVTRDYPHTER